MPVALMMMEHRLSFGDKRLSSTTVATALRYLVSGNNTRDCMSLHNAKHMLDEHNILKYLCDQEGFPDAESFARAVQSYRGPLVTPIITSHADAGRRVASALGDMERCGGGGRRNVVSQAPVSRLLAYRGLGTIFRSMAADTSVGEGSVHLKPVLREASLSADEAFSMATTAEGLLKVATIMADSGDRRYKQVVELELETSQNQEIAGSYFYRDFVL